MIFESESNYPLEQITKCFGEFSIIVKFFQLLSDVLEFFSFSLKPCSIPNTNYWGKSLAYSKLYCRLPHTSLCPYKVIPLPSGKHGSYFITYYRILTSTITDRQKFQSEISSLKIFAFGIEEFNPFWRLINGCNLFWKSSCKLGRKTCISQSSALLQIAILIRMYVFFKIIEKANINIQLHGSEWTSNSSKI